MACALSSDYEDFFEDALDSLTLNDNRTLYNSRRTYLNRCDEGNSGNSERRQKPTPRAPPTFRVKDLPTFDGRGSRRGFVEDLTNTAYCFGAENQELVPFLPLILKDSAKDWLNEFYHRELLFTTFEREFHKHYLSDDYLNRLKL